MKLIIQQNGVEQVSPVKSLAYASKLAQSTRDAYEKLTGETFHAKMTVVNSKGQHLARISYNGRVWNLEPENSILIMEAQ